MKHTKEEEEEEITALSLSPRAPAPAEAKLIPSINSPPCSRYGTGSLNFALVAAAISNQLASLMYMPMKSGSRRPSEILPVGL
ncbi:hypothetical protein Pint_29384 [Pistacia integerrima]|uniref:Uncharacterized protein n=1 Tax=Pistacia integerrima TaxID=434235 RepID=A0ACC0X0V0_9ROSI|nr:hypothetical protein Pint_29384 [Pistacia integerrima]